MSLAMYAATVNDQSSKRMFNKTQRQKTTEKVNPETFQSLETSQSTELAMGNFEEPSQQQFVYPMADTQSQIKPYDDYNAFTPMQTASGADESSVLLKKVNYLITLMESTQDEKTSNITEEVILYFFLGIFIIFIVDSFVRVGKYIR
jgi:hypothetical protein